MFDRILIANRGEIAVRVARTARRLGIRTVAVFSEADAQAMHVAECDEAFLIGPAPARESYLRGERIVEAALRTGARAIHPGYGFLSENEAFAAAVARAGLVFVGPPPAAIRAMGSKSEAKRIMAAAGVPLVPGYHGEDQDPALLALEAERIGYPVLIKATAGGGGKGMRVVERPADFAAALASCRREAAASFADERVLVERYLVSPRHIEIQVFADTHGNCVHLFERDCSVQRRHQKVLEESPAPGMDPQRRAAMGAAAVAACRAIGYVGAGTVEFIVEPGGTFYFMEMNTRLQVEHPVTEMVTGLDLVEWQLRVAAGEPLPLAQERIRLSGHAIEARLYAEDPARGFLPATGRLEHLRFPATGAEVRIDTGVRAGDAISPYYDPMIAKLIVRGEDRGQALSRLAAALGEIEVAGLATNVAFLRRLVAHPAFREARLETGLIAAHLDELVPREAPLPEDALAAAALAELAHEARAARERALASPEPDSPWHGTDGWWLNDETHRELRFLHGEQGFDVVAHYLRDGLVLELPSGRHRAAAREEGDRLAVTLGDRRFRAGVARLAEERIVHLEGASHVLRVHDPLAHVFDVETASGHLTAPMPGTVIAVLAEPGQAVERGAPLLILEAMKMEHTVSAPMRGVVKSVFFRQGEQVSEGAELIELEAP